MRLQYRTLRNWLIIILLAGLLYIVHKVYFKEVKVEHGIQSLSSNQQCLTNDIQLRKIRNPISAIEVVAPCDFKDRIRLFNLAIEKFRSKLMELKLALMWKNIHPSKHTKMVLNFDKDFFQQLNKYAEVKILVLPWLQNNDSTSWSSLHDTSNLLSQQYYDWTGDEELCRAIETPKVLRFKYDEIFNRTCKRDVRNSLGITSLSTIGLNLRSIKSFIYKNQRCSDNLFREPPDFSVYLFIIRNGFVTPNNEVYTGRLKLVLCGCRCERHIQSVLPANASVYPLYDEVMPISQYWGRNIFHRMIEDIPRLVLFLDFLKNNPRVKVLTADSSIRTVELLQILGLDKRRLITGHCRAKVIYMPRETVCCSANVPEIQVLSELYHNYITRNFPIEPRNKVVLIQRSKLRKFSQKESIEKLIETEVKKYNLKFSTYRDDPAPSLNVTMRMFHSAILVIGPHGAGLSNLVFSQPGTFVIEVVCNPPDTALCFQMLSHALGHHYHGIMSTSGCPDTVDVHLDSLRDALRYYLDEIVKMPSIE